jgi:hypothetical protein
MVWNILGKHVEFKITENGEFYLHGKAKKHFCRPSSLFQNDIDQKISNDIEKLGCFWEIHDGESFFGNAEHIIILEKLAGKITDSLINESEKFLSELRNGKSVCSISYSELNYENSIIFCFYFSKKTFNDIFGLLKFLSISDKYEYMFGVNFTGFALKLASESCGFISYDRWIKGSPYYTTFSKFSLNDYSEFFQNN